MTRRRDTGFILSIVLVLLIVTAVMVSNLTMNTQALVSQTDRQQVKAINRNLRLSAQAWMAQQGHLLSETVVLDANGLSTRPTHLSIESRIPAEIRIVAASQWGRQKQSEDYVVTMEEE